MKTKDIARGIALLLPLQPDSDGYSLQAEHDEIFMGGPPPEQMPTETAEELKALGWNWNKSLESWQAFT